MRWTSTKILWVQKPKPGLVPPLARPSYFPPFKVSGRNQFYFHCFLNCCDLLFVRSLFCLLSEARRSQASEKKRLRGGLRWIGLNWNEAFLFRLKFQFERKDLTSELELNLWRSKAAPIAWGLKFSWGLGGQISLMPAGKVPQRTQSN